MKRLSIFIFALIFCFNFFSLNAQDTFNPWSAGLGVNAVNNPIINNSDDLIKYQSWNQDIAGLRINLGRYIKSGFVFMTDVTLNTIKEKDKDSGEEFSYVSVDGMFKYNLTSSSTQLNTLDPYISAGAGYTWFDQIGKANLNAGAGLNIWITDFFGINVQSIYKYATNDYGINHFQHSGGIIFKFGGIDTDKDGIFDNEDECPNNFGLIQFNGCPDSDGDGIEDSLDECPLAAGPIALNGCPDDDGDGVANKNDECPQQIGNIYTKGCPDKDKDGVADKFDQCPDIPGAINNKGCPWPDIDKDGVLDKDDECPNQMGPIENKGCPYPKLSQRAGEIMDTYAKTILFDLGKADLKPSSYDLLNNVVTIMKVHKQEKFHIAGHTDNTFTKEFNLGLSKDRANTVRNYLISRGINPSRLTAKGYGEEKPVRSNDTNEGRKENRRVEIILIR